MSHNDYSNHTTNYSHITSGANLTHHNGNVHVGVINNFHNKPASVAAKRTGPSGRSVEEYTVGWICALPVPEWQASQLLLDEKHEGIPLPANSRYTYKVGMINKHNVVMGWLPATVIGKAAASAVATEMQTLFPKIRVGLLFGVGGGVPGESDVRLGDVVVAYPDKDRRTGGVIQYGYGKAMQDGSFQEMWSLGIPAGRILSALAATQSSTNSEFTDYWILLQSTPSSPNRLSKAEVAHTASNAMSCNDCPAEGESRRYKRDYDYPEFHFGTIASGDGVIKTSVLRDRIARDHGVICSEMEAAGLYSRFPCLVIRGICDYCDSHKNKGWQPYAAAAAAAYAKEFLRNITPGAVEDIKTT